MKDVGSRSNLREEMATLKANLKPRVLRHIINKSPSPAKARARTKIVKSAEFNSIKSQLEQVSTSSDLYDDVQYCEQIGTFFNSNTKVTRLISFTVVNSLPSIVREERLQVFVLMNGTLQQYAPQTCSQHTVGKVHTNDSICSLTNSV